MDFTRHVCVCVNELVQARPLIFDRLEIEP